MPTFIYPTTASPISFDVLLAKMMPHFRYYAKRLKRRKGMQVEIDDVLQDLVGLALEMYHSLIRRGKAVFYSPLVRFAIRRYQEGRRCIGLNTTDILAHQTQILGRCKTCQLSIFDESEREGKKLDERDFMEDWRQGNVAEIVQWKIDYETWLSGLSPRDQKIANDLSYGYTTGEVARKYGVSDGLISQYRKRYAQSWNDFIADKREPA